MRSCQECGEEYAEDDKSKVCMKKVTFNTICGGAVLPPPVVFETEYSAYKCLVCMDSGIVMLMDGKVITCHRGCRG